MLPPNTDDGNCVGPHGPSRRSGRSRCMSSSIGRPVQNCAAYPQLAKQNTEGSAAYPQLGICNYVDRIDSKNRNR